MDNEMETDGYMATCGGAIEDNLGSLLRDSR